MLVFVAEFVIITVANGLFEYLSSFMNCLDFFVTSVECDRGVRCQRCLALHDSADDADHPTAEEVRAIISRNYEYIDCIGEFV